MFSALKRLTGKGDTATPSGVASSPRPSHQAMSHNLQRKFARGVQYNMKIIIKGDRNVGKTALFHRLKGEKFLEEYNPTEEIQVASIQWSYKATDDVVKVDVWDVVDKGKKKKRLEGLKLENAGPSNDVSDEPILDAEFLDVYKGTNGVIMVLDITKNWTFEYIQRELPKVPAHIPVLVLANHCDMAHHRVITPDHVIYFIESQQRPEGCAQIRYAESSMRNGFGLKFLHKFLNLPFLQLQRETLLAQLETNANETAATVAELDVFQTGPDSDYNQFLENLVNKRRQAADSASTAGMHAQAFSGLGHGPVGTSNSVSSQLSSQSASLGQTADFNLRRSSSNPGFVGGGQPIGSSRPSGAGITFGPIGAGQPIPVRSNTATSTQNVTAVSSTSGSSAAEPAPSPPESTAKPSSLMSKIFGKKETEKSENTSISTSGTVLSSTVVSVEEFVPDGGTIDRSFLEDDASSHVLQNLQVQQSVDSESEVEGNGNPLVAGFQDDIDSDEEFGQPISEKSVGIVVDNDSNDEVDSLPLKVPLSLTSDSSKILLPSHSGMNSAPTSDNGAVCEEGSVDGEVSTITGDALDAWLSSDSKWRRSPEGGEDNGSRASQGSRDADFEVNRDSDSTCDKTEKTKKDKNRDKATNVEDKTYTKKSKKKSKDKDREKEKDKDKKKKKSSRKLHSDERSRNELEEFLNGPAVSPVESAYEVL